jgi:hypothetical protein
MVSAVRALIEITGERVLYSTFELSVVVKVGHESNIVVVTRVPSPLVLT